MCDWLCKFNADIHHLRCNISRLNKCKKVNHKIIFLPTKYWWVQNCKDKSQIWTVAYTDVPDNLFFFPLTQVPELSFNVMLANIGFDEGIHDLWQISRGAKMSEVVKSATNLLLFQTVWTWSGCGLIVLNEGSFQMRQNWGNLAAKMSGVGGIVFLTVGLGLSLLVSTSFQSLFNNIQ